MTQLTSQNWERKTKEVLHNQDCKAKGTFEFHQVSEMDPRLLLQDPITEENRDMETCHLLESLKHRKRDTCQGNNQSTRIEWWKEVTKDHQSTQEVLMSMHIKIKFSILNNIHKLQVTKKTHQQTFLPDLR